MYILYLYHVLFYVAAKNPTGGKTFVTLHSKNLSLSFWRSLLGAGLMLTASSVLCSNRDISELARERLQVPFWDLL